MKVRGCAEQTAQHTTHEQSVDRSMSSARTRVPSPPHRPLGATTSELDSLHSQLLALSSTIELLLGSVEHSADIQQDLLVLYAKLKQFQELTEQATLESNKLVDPDRRTWSKLLRCHRTLLKELRDEYEWRRAGLKERIEAQRRAADFAKTQARIVHGNAAVARGAGGGNPFADSVVSLDQVPPLNRASPKIPPLSPPPPPPALYNDTPTPIAAAGARKGKKEEPSPRSTTAGAGAAVAAGGLITVALSPPPLTTSSASATPTTATTTGGHERPARFSLASPRGYSALSSTNHASLEGNSSTLGMLPSSTLPVNPRTTRAAPLHNQVSTSELETGEALEDEGWCCNHLPVACKDRVRTMKRRTWCGITLFLLCVLSLSLIAWSVSRAAQSSRQNNLSTSWEEGNSTSVISSSSSSSTGSSGGGGAVVAACALSQLRLLDRSSSEDYPWWASQSGLIALEPFAFAQRDSLELQVLYPTANPVSQSSSLSVRVRVNSLQWLSLTLVARPQLEGRTPHLLRVFGPTPGPGASLSGLVQGRNRLRVELAGCLSAFETEFDVLPPVAPPPPPPALSSSTAQSPPALDSSTGESGAPPPPPPALSSSTAGPPPALDSSTGASLPPPPLVDSSSTGAQPPPEPGLESSSASASSPPFIESSTGPSSPAPPVESSSAAGPDPEPSSSAQPEPPPAVESSSSASSGPTDSTGAASPVDDTSSSTAEPSARR